MRKHWWKIIAIALMVFVLPMAFLGDVSVQIILHETIRNLYFHVTMWFSMFIIFAVSLVYSIRFLAKGKLEHDLVAQESATVGLVYGMIGIVTGMIWANFTWGAPWVNDPQLNGAAITVLSYVAYMILRGSIKDEAAKARISAVYNIFAFVLMFILIGILPRMNDSLHPGKGGNPGFGNYDLKSSMRLVFYPAIIAWTLIGVWIFQLRVRIQKLQKQ